MIEKWTQWIPVDNATQKYSLETLTNTFEYFGLVLSSHDAHKKVQVRFSNGVDIYRMTCIDDRQQTLLTLEEQYGKSFYEQWTFFQVNYSHYIKWISQESDTWSNYFSLIHFSFITSHAIIDVIADYEPIVEHVS